jgi:hypothetical protein
MSIVDKLTEKVRGAGVRGIRQCVVVQPISMDTEGQGPQVAWMQTGMIRPNARDTWHVNLSEFRKLMGTHHIVGTVLARPRQHQQESNS